MGNESKYITLQNLEIYQLSRELSGLAWEIYEPLDWHIKKINGDQFIESTDSTGANIAEGYGRFHYLDKIKFFYNCRGSLMECAQHWIELLFERQQVSQEDYNKFKEISSKFLLKLNRYITATYETKNRQIP